MRKVSWFRFPLQGVRVLPTTAVAPFRGALLSVLFLAGLLFAVPIEAQNTDPTGNTTCDDNGNCASNGNEITVTAGDGDGGTPGASNPTAPGSNSGYANLGMGAGPDVPTDGISLSDQRGN